jgi:glycosyltransferase involved in cell wall biosynthesis
VNGHLVVGSPLPPSRSGVADYTVKLLEHLRQDWEITVIVENGSRAWAPFEGVDVIHASSWDWYSSVAEVDRILWCVGNSMFHTYVEPLVSVHGGVVLAHDVRLNSLSAYRAIELRDSGLLVAAIRDRYGVDVANELVGDLDFSSISPTRACLELRRRLDASEANLFRQVVQGADLVAVHSLNAQRMAAREVGEAGPRVLQVPFGHPTPTPGGDRSHNLISTFGLVASEKGAVLLVEAFALARTSVSDLELRFVGPVDEQLQRELLDLASRYSVDDAVSFTGWVSAEEFEVELALCAVAVQLRATDNGESSAAVAECLAAGVPTIVTRMGAQAEIDDDTVVKVDGTTSPVEVAEAIIGLMKDVQKRAQHGIAAREFARARGFGRAASALSRLLLSAPRPRRA